MRWKILLIILIEIHLVYCQMSQTLNKLLNDTFNNYDKRIRPFENERPLIFSSRITVAMLIKLASEAQTVSFNMAQYLRWQDPRLAWDPAKYNNTNQIYVPASSLWMPTIFFYNSIQTDSALTDPTALILSNGNVTVYLPQFVDCVSKIVMDRFPFDTQYVFIGQTSALLPIQEMDVVLMQPPELDESYFLGNSEFDFIKVTPRYRQFQEEGQTRFAFDYIFQLKRKTTYYTTVIVIPVFLSMIIDVVGVFSPGTSKGENVTIALATFFALVILLGIVADAMPKSNSMSVIGIYILVMIILCAISVAVAIFLRVIEEMVIDPKDPVPSLLRKIFFLRENKKRENKTSHHSIWIDPDNKKIATIAMANAAEHSFSLQKNKEVWEEIFEKTRYFLLFLFQLFNIINLLVYFRYSWLPSSPMPATFL